MKFAINIGLINFKGDMMELKMNIPYQFENSIEGLNELCKLIANFIKKLNINKEKILNINVNVSGRVNPESGYSFSQFNFEERPLADVLTEKLGYKVTIDNDTRAMTYGEYMQGCVKGEKNIIFVNVSWGLGIGIIIDGRIYTGKSGFSGEFGHVSAYENEIICHCGKKGCIETEASGSALHRILLERIRNGENSILSDRISSEDPITLDEIIAAVNKEDVLCIEIVEEIGQKLGKQIAGLINIFNPELVIIGGTLSLTGDYITQPIKTAIRKYSLNLVNKDSVILTSKLKDKAGIVGACMLGTRQNVRGLNLGHPLHKSFYTFLIGHIWCPRSHVFQSQWSIRPLLYFIYHRTRFKHYNTVPCTRWNLYSIHTLFRIQVYLLCHISFFIKQNGKQATAKNKIYFFFIRILMTMRR